MARAPARVRIEQVVGRALDGLRRSAAAARSPVESPLVEYRRCSLVRPVVCSPMFNRSHERAALLKHCCAFAVSGSLVRPLWLSGETAK